MSFNFNNSVDKSFLASAESNIFISMLIVYIFALACSLFAYSKVALVRTKDNSNNSKPTDVSSAPATSRWFRSSFYITIIALTLQVLYLITRGLSAGRLPWGNLFEYTVLLSGVAVVLILGQIYSNFRYLPLLPWVLTPVMALLFYAGTKLYIDSAPVPPALKSGWYYIHVTTVSIGASVALVSGAASLVFIIRSWSRSGSTPQFVRLICNPLPSPEVIDGLAYRTCIWALPIFGLGIIFGAIWAEAAWGRFWNWDPKETMSLVTWVLYAAYLHSRATRSVGTVFPAWVNVLAFATMIFNLFFINQVVSGLHSYAGLN